jgi:excisionase family DNA binding protein
MAYEYESSHPVPKFYTVPEAARVLRVDPATVYRAIRAGEFPAVRLRTRYVVPVQAVERLAAEAAESLACVDVADLATRPPSGAPSPDGRLPLAGGCPCGAVPEPGRQVCRKCSARDRWARRRSGPAGGR